MDNNDRYLSFEEVEDICKGLSFTPQCKEGKSSSIHPYQQTRTECQCHGSVYSKRKLTLPEKPRCLVFMWSYTFHELDLPDRLTRVHVFQHNCYDPVEPLNYAAGFNPICVYCASEVQDFEYL